jgi:nucleoside-diphosphate-sugar epimerase
MGIVGRCSTLECPPVATLLTGVGYIGAALLRRLHERGERVVALDNFFSTSREAVETSLPPTVELIEGDVADPDDVDRALERASAGADAPIAVYHLAAQPSAAIAAREPALTERSNLVGARVLLQAAHERHARVVFGGSFRVYGDELTNATVDEDTPYGRVGDLSHLSKVYVEQLARMVGGAFVSVRLGVTYGRSPVMKTSAGLMTVPNLFCMRAVAGEALQVLEDRPVAFIHVDDAAAALVFAADHLAQDGWQVVNAAPEVATIGQVARTVQHIAEERGQQVNIRGAAASEAGFVVESRLQQAGWQPTHSLSEGLLDVYDFFGGAQR